MTTVFRVPVLPNRPVQSVYTTLDGRRYRFDLAWNARISRWFISIYSGTGTALLLGKGLRVKGDVLRTAGYNSALPDGALTVQDPQNLGIEPTLESLGTTHLLTFIPSSSLA